MGLCFNKPVATFRPYVPVVYVHGWLDHHGSCSWLKQFKPIVRLRPYLWHYTNLTYWLPSIMRVFLNGPEACRVMTLIMWSSDNMWLASKEFDMWWLRALKQLQRHRHPTAFQSCWVDTSKYMISFQILHIIAVCSKPKSKHMWTISISLLHVLKTKPSCLSNTDGTSALHFQKSTVRRFL